MQHLRQHWLPILVTTIGVLASSIAGLVLYGHLDNLISATELQGPTTIEVELPEGELAIFHSTTLSRSTPAPPSSVITLVTADGVALPVRSDLEWGTQSFQDPFEFYGHFATVDVPANGTYRLTIDSPGDFAITPDPITELRVMIPSAIVATIGSLLAVGGAIWWAVAYTRSRKRGAAGGAPARSTRPPEQPVPVTPPPGRGRDRRQHRQGP